MNRKRKSLIILSIMAMIVFISGLTYAFFTATVSGGDKSSEVKINTATLGLAYSEEPITCSTDGFLPGTTCKHTFYVENVGTATVESYDVYLWDVINDFEKKEELVFELTCKTVNTKSKEVLGACSGENETVIPTKNSEIHTGDAIDVGITHQYEISITFKETGSNQNYNQGKTFSGKIFLIKGNDPLASFEPNGSIATSKNYSIVVEAKETTGASVLKYVWSETNDADASSGKTFENGHTIMKEEGDGEYYLCVYVKDAKGESNSCSLPYLFDNSAPEVTFSPNGSDSLSNKAETVLTVSDASNISELKYIWSTADITDDKQASLFNESSIKRLGNSINLTRTSASTGESFTSGDTITKSDGNGEYYLCVFTKDTLDNMGTTCSKPFKLSNTPPEVTFDFNGNSEPQSSHSIKVKSEASILKYVWTLDSNTDASKGTTFKNDETLTKSDGTGKYYLCVYAENGLGNGSTTCTSEPFVFDNNIPEIVFGINKSKNTSKSQSTKVSIIDASSMKNLKYIWSTSNNASASEGKNFTSGEVLSKSDESGNYYLCIYAEDIAGNKVNKCSDIFVLDNVSPTVSFSQDGNKTISKKQSTKVTVTDSSPIKTLKYVWTTTSNTDASKGTAFTSGQTITKSDGTGNYYLCIYAEDNLGNSSTTCTSAPFVFDNNVPAIVFGINQNNTASKSQSTKVTITETSSIKNLKYVWTTTSNTDASKGTTFKSGNTITKSDGTGNYYLCVYAEDIAGNKVNKCSDVFALDNASPIVSFSQNGNEQISKTQSSKVTVSDTTLIKILKYIWSMSSEADASKGTAFKSDETITKSDGTGNYYLCIYAEDNLGNGSTTCTSSPFVFDNSAPGVIFETNKNDTALKTQSTKVTVTDTSSIKTLKYIWSTTSSANASEGKTFTSGEVLSKSDGSGNYYLCIYAEDTAGNKVNTCSDIFVLDNASPVVSFSQNGDKIISKIQKPKVTVSDASPIKTLKYVWTTTSNTDASNGTPFKSDETITKSDVTGEYYLCIYAEDSLGNGSTTCTSIPFNFDNTVPTIVFGLNKNNTALKSQSTKVTVSDNSSMRNLKYVWSTTSNANASKGTTFKNGETITKSDGSGNYYLCVYAEDIAGNQINTCSDIFALDNASPIVSFSQNGNEKISKTQSTKVTVTDASPIKTLKYIWSISSGTDASKGTTFKSGETIAKSDETGNYYLCIYAEDNLGNKDNICSYIFKLDNKKPEISFATNGNVSEAKSQSSKVTVVDDSNLNLKYVWSTSSTADFKAGKTFTNGSVLSKSDGTGKYYLCIYAEDEALNRTSTCSNAFNVNNTAPSVTFTTNGNPEYKMYQSTKVVSSAAIIKYIWSTKPNANASNGKVLQSETPIGLGSVDGSYYLCVYVEDAIGNSNNVCSNVFNLDNTAPEVTFSPNGSQDTSKYINTEVTATDLNEIVILKFLWANVSGTSAADGDTFTSGSTISQRATRMDQYLCVYAEDSAGVFINICSEPFKTISKYLVGAPQQFNSTFHFLNSPAPVIRKNIASVTFAATKEVPSNALGSWDASEAQNGTIIGWYVASKIDGLYDVTIGQDGGVKANPNSWALFGALTNATEINVSNLNTSDTIIMKSMFQNCFSLKKLDLSSFDTSDATNMSNMFDSCRRLEAINLSSFKTLNVTTMQSMFLKCETLISLDLSAFDTTNVTNMQSMFESCLKLENINLSSFETLNVTNMAKMFGSCEVLTNLNLSKFNTSKVTDMQYMFQCCEKMTVIDLSSFDTSNVTNMVYMFDNCTGVETINFGPLFDTSNVLLMYFMFAECHELTALNLSTFNTSKTTDMGAMFRNCSKLRSLDLSKFDTSNVTDFVMMFQNCLELSTLNISSFDASKVESLGLMFSQCLKLENIKFGPLFNIQNATTIFKMFSECKKLKELDLSMFNIQKITELEALFQNCISLENIKFSTLFNTSNVENMSNMFNNCQKLKELDLSMFNTRIVSNMKGMFQNCNNIESIKLSPMFNTSNVTDMSYMFTNCNMLSSLDLTSFNTAKVTTMSFMFNGCANLKTLDLSKFNTQSVTVMNSMFQSCTNLESIKFSSQFNTSNVTDMAYMFNKCDTLKTLDLSMFNTKSVTNMSTMFQLCTNLESIKFSSLFNTSNVTNMSYMFNKCSSLLSLDLTSFKTANVTTMKQMFTMCTKLTNVNLSTFDTTKVEDMYAMFYECSSLTTLDLSSFKTTKLTDIRAMFSKSVKLTTLDIRNFVFTNVTAYADMLFNVPTTVAIKASSAGKTWLNAKVSSYKNISVV